MNAAGTYSQNQAERPLPNSPVFNTIEENSKRLAELSEAVSQLSQKIGPILRPEPTMMQANKVGAEPPVVESEVVIQLRNQGTALNVLIQRVVEMRERSEV